MSILKGILHHWNKTNKAYDTIHPETEVAQITDWNNGVVNTLASTALGSLVTTLSSDSLLAKLIGKVLTASGARYQSGPNGYICFGSYFGSHIIQWVFGYFTAPGLVSCVLPITADTVLAVLAIDDVGSPGAGVIGWVTSQTDGQQVTFGCDVNISRFVYAAICR